MKKTISKNKVKNENYHNTEKLLKVYRDAKWNLELSIIDAKKEFADLFGTSVEEFLESIYLAGMDINDTELKDIVENIKKNYMMIEILEDSMFKLRKTHKYGESYYYVLYYSYLYRKELTVDEILNKLKRHKIKKSRYYMLKKEAIKALSNFVWGYTKAELITLLDYFLLS